jgi:NADPH:quinone reductase-like Zn-dependent oxidoreductase
VKAAVLRAVGGPPEFGEFAEPTAGPGQVLVDVTASGVHHIVLGRASGAFGAPALPSVPGTDGVGRTTDGRRVFFDGAVAPYGSWAERTVVSESDVLEPADGLDDVTAAALGNTGLAAWLGLSWRAALRAGESVLVLGATGAVGTVATQAARALGAGLVVAADQASDRLELSADRGAHAIVELASGDRLAEDLHRATDGRGFDVIIDPVWGAPALAAMKAAARGARHIQIGNAAGATMELPAGIVRAGRLDIRGFSVFDAPLELRQQAYRALTERAVDGLITIDVEAVPLADVARAWERQRSGPATKLVLVPGSTD